MDVGVWVARLQAESGVMLATGITRKRVSKLKVKGLSCQPNPDVEQKSYSIV